MHSWGRHVLPDKLETIVEELLVLLSPYLPGNLAVQIRIVSGLNIWRQKIIIRRTTTLVLLTVPRFVPYETPPWNGYPLL